MAFSFAGPMRAPPLARVDFVAGAEPERTKAAAVPPAARKVGGNSLSEIDRALRPTSESIGQCNQVDFDPRAFR